jgi:hypothetical protein
VKQNKHPQSGFALMEIILLAVALAAIASVGAYLYYRGHTAKPKNSSLAVHASSTRTTPQSHTTLGSAAASADLYAGWKTYADTGYAEASGIIIKYPPDWQVKVGGSNGFAWSITPTGATAVGIDVRDVLLSSGTTPQQEWEDCPSADACGPVPGSTKLRGGATTINGLASYNTEMQTGLSTYYVTVIKGDKPAANGTVVFVEFTITNPDASALNVYNQLVASATF